jgi:hypothetical protein
LDDSDRPYDVRGAAVKFNEFVLEQ